MRSSVTDTITSRAGKLGVKDRSDGDPRTGSISSAARASRAVGLRTRPNVVHPARTKARATALPIMPLAPVTRTRFSMFVSTNALKKGRCDICRQTGESSLLYIEDVVTS